MANTHLPGYWVSTVFLGMNHAFIASGKPEWFETMVFATSEVDGEVQPSWTDVARDRYATWEEAEAGHAEMVRRWEA